MCAIFAQEFLFQEQQFVIKSQSVSRFICGVLFFNLNKERFKVSHYEPYGGVLTFKSEDVKNMGIEDKLKWYWIGDEDKIEPCDFQKSISDFLRNRQGDLGAQTLLPDRPNKFLIEVA